MGATVVVHRQTDLRRLDLKVREVTLHEAGSSPLILFRRMIGGESRGFVTPGPRLHISHRALLRPDSVVIGEAKIEGEVKFGEGVFLRNCELIAERGPIEIPDNAHLDGFVYRGSGKLPI